MPYVSLKIVNLCFDYFITSLNVCSFALIKIYLQKTNHIHTKELENIKLKLMNEIEMRDQNNTNGSSVRHIRSSPEIPVASHFFLKFSTSAKNEV